MAVSARKEAAGRVSMLGSSDRCRVKAGELSLMHGKAYPCKGVSRVSFSSKVISRRMTGKGIHASFLNSVGSGKGRVLREGYQRLLL